MQTKIIRRCIIEEETEKLNETPLHCPPSGKSIHQTISWDTRIVRDPLNLIYLMHLSPPSSYSNKAFRNHVLSSFPDLAIRLISDCIRQALLAFFGKSPKLPKLQNTLYTLKRCGLCLSTNLLSRYDNGRGNEKRLE